LIDSAAEVLGAEWNVMLLFVYLTCNVLSAVNTHDGRVSEINISHPCCS